MTAIAPEDVDKKLYQQVERKRSCRHFNVKNFGFTIIPLNHHKG
jgi:hypothetical protein